MKKAVQMRQICKLYGISPDSLRYYEKKGLIHPRRADNQYRLYTLKDIWRLNVIRDLLKLGFGTDRIRDYLKHRTVEATSDLLQEEEQELQRQIRELSLRLKDVQKRRQDLQEALDQPQDEILFRHFPRRSCLVLKEQIEQDEDIDYLLTRLAGRMEEQLAILGNGDTGSVLEMQPDGSLRCTCVMICIQQGEGDFILEEGEYLVLTYGGPYDQHHEHIRQLQREMERKHLRQSGPFLEFLLVDVHETHRPEEYITQLQVRVKRQTEEKR